MFQDVKDFISANIFHSQLWDALDADRQEKAVNNAAMNLRNYYGDARKLTTEAVAYQTLWLLKIDDSIQRAGQGVTQVSVSGMSISLSQVDRSIAPEVLRLMGRRIGRYGLAIEDTFRHRTRPEYAKRGY
ncbi:hypothetical protein MOD91_18175 [Bacillus haynesii]|uniref:hypothetical protein n=1 Tax=Bacillus haynesii TaxID=1925021 RepID=UPI00227FB3CB|nr:hypothetical protein [Bacillus haynesii]MCY8048452.1 hypothetical protein [Bacillus haynesii]MCY8668790.1 hypothetical protein [Bacillus haynesii]